MPDALLDLPDREASPDVRMTHDTAAESVFMQTRDGSAFVRAVLPVRLTDGRTVRFGVWLDVGQEQLRHAATVWREPEYADLRLHGWLANALPGWGLLGRPVTAAVLDPDEAPYCVSSPDPELSAVLTDAWDPGLLADLPPVD